MTGTVPVSAGKGPVSRESEHDLFAPPAADPATHLTGAVRRRGPVFEVTLRFPRDDDAVRRLRWVLKSLWRQHGLRCLGIVQVEGEAEP